MEWRTSRRLQEQPLCTSVILQGDSEGHCQEATELGKSRWPCCTSMPQFVPFSTQLCCSVAIFLCNEKWILLLLKNAKDFSVWVSTASHTDPHTRTHTQRHICHLYVTQGVWKPIFSCSNGPPETLLPFTTQSGKKLERGSWKMNGVSERLACWHTANADMNIWDPDLFRRAAKENGNGGINYAFWDAAERVLGPRYPAALLVLLICMSEKKNWIIGRIFVVYICICFFPLFQYVPMCIMFWGLQRCAVGESRYVCERISLKVSCEWQGDIFGK